jgi:hypothetical protein
MARQLRGRRGSISSTGVKDLVEVEVDGETITATDEHPFWVDDQGRWIDAEDLQPGDLLLLADGTTTEVDAVAHHTAVLTVHDLTVEGIHTYHVALGDDLALVHNADCDDLEQQARAARDELGDATGSRHATVTGAYDPTTGDVVAGHSGPGFCAETDCVRQLVERGSDPADIRFVDARRPRTGREVEICVRCQGCTRSPSFPPAFGARLRARGTINDAA